MSYDIAELMHVCDKWVNVYALTLDERICKLLIRRACFAQQRRQHIRCRWLFEFRLALSSTSGNIPHVLYHRLSFLGLLRLFRAFPCCVRRRVVRLFFPLVDVVEETRWSMSVFTSGISAARPTQGIGSIFPPTCPKPTTNLSQTQAVTTVQ